MSLWRLAKQSLGFYWRTNLGVLLTVVVSTAILTGALVVGDSVRYSLRMMVRSRLGIGASSHSDRLAHAFISRLAGGLSHGLLRPGRRVGVSQAARF